MTLITIRERTPAGPNGENATISFDNGPLYNLTISDPFAEKEEQELEWYFEKHLEYPFTDQVKAQACAKSVSSYGEKLFKQVFSDNDVYSEYKDCLKSGLTTLEIEIAGTPAFHRWHWEALKDPKQEHPLVLEATMVRKNSTPQNRKISLRPSTTLNILIVTARPAGKDDVGYRTISRPMVEALRTSGVPAQIDILRPGTYQALYEHLREVTAKHGVGYYHVIHFDVHGGVLSYDEYKWLQEEQQSEQQASPKGQAGQKEQAGQEGKEEPPKKPAKVSPYVFKGTSYESTLIGPYKDEKAFLSFERVDSDKPDLIEASILASLLIEQHIPIAILNACQSAKQVGSSSETSLGSRLVASGVQMVLAMGYSVTVTAAALLMETLYQQLLAKQTLATAIRFARQELYNRKQRRAHYGQMIELEDWLLPVVYQNQPQNLTMRDFTPDEAASYYSQQAIREQEWQQSHQPTYGFVGRDVDILQLEKRLLTKRNIVLVRGMGGAGKTTLLQHLRIWWQTTGLVSSVFYFGYDERAWTRQQLLNDIAKKLLTPVQYAAFQPLPLDVQQAMLAQRLRSERHLLILDNLESITGSPLAIPNTLPPQEQRDLHNFLKALSGGKTLVLLGSRGGESWLAEHTFADNSYDLPGLDSEAASILAERILERHHATQYRKDPDLRQLLKLLDGFPLALEVVLPNLTHQTPAQILTALQAGNIDLDKGDAQQKTESIIRCIDYSHSNLSPTAQQLLLCLAPFTSVINQYWLEQYTKQLKQQPALANLPFADWPTVLQEAQNWGLLSPDPEIPVTGYLRLQPVLPYFLRNRLSTLPHTPDQTTTKAAIDTAFRQHYHDIGDALYDLLEAKEPNQRLLGRFITKLEYENLMTALNLALDAQVSILNIYRALTLYLDTTQEHQLGLQLGEYTLERLEQYPQEQLTGELEDELGGIIDNVAKRQMLLKQYEKAEKSYKKALAISLASKQESIKRRSSGVYHNLGIIAQEQRLWPQAEHYFQQALQIKIEFNDSYEQASTYHHLGIIAQEQRQWPQAEQYFQQALQIKIEFNDRYEQAGTYHHLGRVAQEQRQWPQAEQYFQQALQIFIEFNDRFSQARIYHHLGMVAQEQRQWPQAQHYFQQALQIFIEFNDRYAQAITYHHLGMVAQEQRQWPQAQHYLQQALQIKIEFNDRFSQASTYHQLGRLAEDQEQWEEARNYFLQALEIFVSYEDSHYTGITLRSLARVWQDSGNAELPTQVATIVGGSVEDVEKWFRVALQEEEEEGEG